MRFLVRAATALTALAVAAGALQAQGSKVTAPTGVTVTSSAYALTVSWVNVANAVSYQVNRREGTVETTLGSAPGSPWSGPLPAAGKQYEYQVVAIGSGGNNTAGSNWIAYTVPVPLTTSTGVIVTEPRPGMGGAITPTVIPAGPTYAAAGSTKPGQIVVYWKEVPGATRYRIVRSSDAPAPEAMVTEQGLGGLSGFIRAGDLIQWVDAPVDLKLTFTYKVLALFPTATGGYTVSTPSPAATARSVPVVQPTGLRYAVALANKPGVVKLTLSWNAVPDAVGYAVTGGEKFGEPEFATTETSHLFKSVPAGYTYRLCVGSQFTPDVQDRSTASCIDVRLQ
jgi:hypothetical protein